MLKYLRLHPVPRVTIGGGFGKLSKLAQGAMDLHSGRSQVDFAWLAARVPDHLQAAVRSANTAQHVLELAGDGLAQRVAEEALVQTRALLGDAPVVADIIITDRAGRIIAHAA